MKILVAYDGSSEAEAALEEVARRPWPDGSRVLVVTIIDGPVPPTSGVEIYAPVFEQLRANYREEACTRIKKALERFKSRPDLETNYELRDGSTKNGLLEAIRDWEADLVVAGSHASGGLARLFLGSVCHALVTHAPCNVEIVKLVAARSPQPLVKGISEAQIA